MNTAGCRAIVSSTPLPPSSPALTRWRESPRYVVAHDGQRISDREPQALRTTPSGREALEKVTACSPGRPETTKPRSRMGQRHHPQRSPCAKKSSIWRRCPWRKSASSMARSSGSMTAMVERRCDNVPGQEWYPAVPSERQRDTPSDRETQRDTKISRKKFSAAGAFGASGLQRPSAPGPTDRMPFGIGARALQSVEGSMEQL